MSNYQLYHGDCLEVMKQIPAGSVDLVLTDPPYNIGIAEWDKIDNYIGWCAAWLSECRRVLKTNGVLYFWHNDMVQIAQLMERSRIDALFLFVSFCIWDKTEAYRAQSWKNLNPDGAASLRSWFNRCEYCLEFHCTGAVLNERDKTGLERILSDDKCFRSLKDWYAAEKARLGLTDKDIARKYTEVTNREPYMLRHYFQDSQFAIPTLDIWERVYMPLGFDREYEDLRKEYEDLRCYHRCDANHCNVWTRPVLQFAQKEGASLRKAC